MTAREGAIPNMTVPFTTSPFPISAISIACRFLETVLLMTITPHPQMVGVEEKPICKICGVVWQHKR